MIVPKKGGSFSDFVASLVIDFPTDNIPIFTDEKDWVLFGNLLVQENSFAKNGAPSPNGFSSRTQWEQALFQSMSSYN
jgi:hypothetical protein